MHCLLSRPILILQCKMPEGSQAAGRVEANDPFAFRRMVKKCSDEKDKKGAVEYWTKRLCEEARSTRGMISPFAA